MEWNAARYASYTLRMWGLATTMCLHAVRVPYDNQSAWDAQPITMLLALLQVRPLSCAHVAECNDQAPVIQGTLRTMTEADYEH